MAPVRNILIDMLVAIESCRSLLYAGVQWLDLRNNLEEKMDHLKASGQSFEAVKKRFEQAAKITDLLSPLTKYVVSEMAVKLCYDAQQLHGGMGYMREMAVERMVRDVRITTIYEGTSQIHIASCLKSVMNDVLSTIFDDYLSADYPTSLHVLKGQVKEMRNIFTEIKELIQDKDDSDFREAAAKEIVDVYCHIYQGMLLLQESKDNAHKEAIAKRFISKYHALAKGSLQSIKNNQFDDIKDLDKICY